MLTFNFYARRWADRAGLFAVEPAMHLLLEIIQWLLIGMFVGLVIVNALIMCALLLNKRELARHLQVMLNHIGWPLRLGA
jgi:hypothetical protein